MSEKIGRLLAAGNVAELFEWGSRILKLYRAAAGKPTAFREAAIHAAVEAMGLPVPAVWGCRPMGYRVRPHKRKIIRGADEGRSERHTQVLEDTRAAACAHSCAPGAPVREFEGKAGDKHRPYRASR
jgi:hypothetical protein